MKAIYVISFVLIVLQLSTAVAEDQSSVQLKASVQFSEKMQPLDPLLWTGNYFDEKAATALLKDKSVNSSIWKKIPAWQAGDWESTQATTTKLIKYINGQSRPYTPNSVYTWKGGETHGWQKDKNGDIWEWYHSGYWTETELDDDVVHSFIKFGVPGADEYPDLYSESIHFSVDKSTNKIVYVDQRKSWRRYVYVAPGLMKEEQVHTTYDEKGEPDVTSWTTALEKRTKTFAENEILLANTPHFRQTLQKDFFNYLKNNGLEALIPPEQLPANGGVNLVTGKSKE